MSKRKKKPATAPTEQIATCSAPPTFDVSEPEEVHSSALRDRIVEVRKMYGRELQLHPRNARTHPDNQKAALSGILTEVGKAGVLYAYRSARSGGALVLFDGHLRVTDYPDELWWVAITDLSDAEADKMVLVHDPIGAMAGIHEENLEALLREVQTGDAALAKMLTDLAEQAGVIPPEALASLAGVTQPEIVEDEVPEPPAVPVTKRGDIWLLGDVHYECESCHKRYTVEEGKAMGGVCPCDG